MIFLDQDANVEIGFTPTMIDANIKHNIGGFIILAFGDENWDKICPGDFVFVSYDKVPIIKDMQCDENFLDAKEDFELGGHNDWYIDDISKYPKGGFMIKAKRRLWTRDKFDFWVKKEP